MGGNQVNSILTAIQHTKGNRNPSIADTIQVDTTPFDLSASTVTFSMRLRSSSTLKVAAASAVVVLGPAGTVRYDWTSGDVDTAGDYVAWWTVTTSGKTQDTPEFTITMLDHVPGTSRYLSLEEFKKTRNLNGLSFADQDATIALEAASRGLEDAYGALWTLSAPATTRYYTRLNDREALLGDVISITSLSFDYGIGDIGPGTYSTVLQTTDYRLLPIFSGLAAGGGNGEPYQSFHLARGAGLYYIPSGVDAIKVVGQFGYETVPAGVKSCVGLIAQRLLMRAREAPFGIIQVGEDGTAVRAAQIARDPDIALAMRALTPLTNMAV
jgi:hypothetical protein